LSVSAATMREAEQERISFMPGNLRKQAARLKEELDSLTQQVDARKGN